MNNQSPAANWRLVHGREKGIPFGQKHYVVTVDVDHLNFFDYDSYI